MRDVGRTATGEVTGLETLSVKPPVPRKPGLAEQLTHDYRLRPDVVIKVDLPEDLNKAEAERLASWLKTLPFGES